MTPRKPPHRTTVPRPSRAHGGRKRPQEDFQEEAVRAEWEVSGEGPSGAGGEWLTPEEFARRTGLSPEVVQNLVRMEAVAQREGGRLLFLPHQEPEP
jgi:hypothetical protein